MPHKRPQNKNRQDLMLVRNFLKKNQAQEVNLGENDFMNEDVEMINQTGGGQYPQVGGVQIDGVAVGGGNEMNTGDGPDYVFLSGNEGPKPLTEPTLVTQLRELRRTIKKHPIVQLGGSDLHDFLKINQELNSATQVSKEACGQLTRHAQENILGLVKELKGEVTHHKKTEIARKNDLARVDNFLEKYEQFSCLCQTDFQKVYQEISSLRSDLASTLSQNAFHSNNRKLSEMLGVTTGWGLWGKSNSQLGGASKTEVHQLLRDNQRQLDDYGESMFGSSAVQHFKKMQVTAQEKMSFDLSDLRQVGGSKDFDEQDLFGEAMTPSEKALQFQYIDAKKKLLEKQAEFLAVKEANLKKH